MTGDAKILAIETSTSVVGVAVARGSRILFDNWLIEPMGHSSLLLPKCSEALDKAETVRRPRRYRRIGWARIIYRPQDRLRHCSGVGSLRRLPVIPVLTFDVPRSSEPHTYDGSPCRRWRLCRAAQPKLLPLCTG